MFNQEGNEYEKDLNLQIMCFFVVKFEYSSDSYVQCSTRMSLNNATKLCNNCRDNDPEGDYKVHAELEY